MGDAVFRQKSGVLGVGIVAPCGVVTPDQLSGLGELARELGSTGCKLTTRQTMIMLIPEKKLPDLRAGVARLSLRVGVFGEVVRNVKSCAGGAGFCLRAAGDVFTLGSRLQETFMDQPVPKDLKISVAGCPRGCTEPHCADFGVIATGQDRFTVFAGGRGGSRKPLHGQKLLPDLSGEGVLRVLSYVLERYRELAHPHERLCGTIARTGLEPFSPPAEVLAGHTVTEEDNDFLSFAGLK
ncbi:nitrite reductase [Clostridiales bacterium PH28_bin88]|nr:nitrite reductase [Clostridiales bacterium PH28_bin88]